MGDVSPGAYLLPASVLLVLVGMKIGDLLKSILSAIYEMKMQLESLLSVG